MVDTNDDKVRASICNRLSSSFGFLLTAYYSSLACGALILKASVLGMPTKKTSHFSLNERLS
jgi:hypothetical protein